jgi:beta-carotene hydroxylase
VAEAESFPGVRDLGADLLHVSAARRALVVVRPFVACLGYWACATHGWWLPAISSLVAMMFLTYTSSSHDYVHRTLGLPRAANEVLLAATELLGLRSGHAFRLTHLHHHRRFPHADDVEAHAASRGFFHALVAGPGHQTRLLCWAWRHGTHADRAWIAAETAVVVGVLALASIVRPLAWYALLVSVGAWLYPLATVWWPHRPAGDSPLVHTRAFRGRVVPALFLQHTYHLEHHLYPMVASVNWRALARRLDRHLARAGVVPVTLP